MKGTKLKAAKEEDKRPTGTCLVTESLQATDGYTGRLLFELDASLAASDEVDEDLEAAV